MSLPPIEPIGTAFYQIAALSFELKLFKLIRALKAFNPDQPRVPAGNPDGGQWTSGNGEGALRVQLAGEIPQNDTPDVPEQEPPGARARNAIVKTVARATGFWRMLMEAPSWLAQYSDYIIAYNDPPKTLDELRQTVSDPARGYDIHHIVEQTSAERDGFPRSMIDDPDNLVRISTLKHWEINAWYQTPNDQFAGLTPREFLRGRAWDIRMGVGLDALVRFGVLGQ